MEHHQFPHILKTPDKAQNLKTQALFSLPYRERQYEYVHGNIILTKVDAEYPDNKLTGATFEVYKDCLLYTS